RGLKALFVAEYVFNILCADMASGHHLTDCIARFGRAEDLDEEGQSDGFALERSAASGEGMEILVTNVTQATECVGECLCGSAWLDGKKPFFVRWVLDVFADIPRAGVESDLFGPEKGGDGLVVGPDDDGLADQSPRY